jgi:putative PIN family toxin of toxin-antitoxin system
MNKLRLVLDTNVFLVALAPQYRYYWLYECILRGGVEVCVSTEILLEYEEIIASRYGLHSTEAKLDYLLLLPNVLKTEPVFRWNLILSDPDDNKFVDCYLAAGADYLVGNDRHFDTVASLEFPPVRVLKYEEFERRFKSKLLP